MSDERTGDPMFNAMTRTEAAFMLVQHAEGALEPLCGPRIAIAYYACGRALDELWTANGRPDGASVAQGELIDAITERVGVVFEPSDNPIRADLAVARACVTTALTLLDRTDTYGENAACAALDTAWLAFEDIES